ncbi:MAG TPA: glycosyltransferase [Candidatus Paceibacterota bacterium]
MISTIISTKNGSKYIAKALESVAAQKGVELEVVVVSDGSTDATAEVVRAFAAANPSIPLRLIELKQNIGPGLARNLAILGGEAEGMTHPECNGEYIAIIDDDDILLNDHKLRNQLAALESDKRIVVVGSEKTEFAREDGTHIFWLTNRTDPDAIHANMLSYNPVITSSVLFRKDAFKSVSGFKKMYLAEDYDLWLRMGLIGKISNAADAETRYTIRDAGASKSRMLEMATTVLGLVREYKKSYPGYFKAIVKAYLRVAFAYIKTR